MLKTFAELEISKEVTYEELRDSLKNYAEEGASISGIVVISIIERLRLTPEQKRELHFWAKYGRDFQNEISFLKDAEEYSKVVRFLMPQL